MAATLLLIATAAFACGGDDDPPESPTPPPPTPTLAGSDDCLAVGGRAMQISENHEHELAIPAGDFKTSEDSYRTYSMEGLADHAHFVDLTGEQLTTMAEGNVITVTSSATAGHRHSVALGCGFDED